MVRSILAEPPRNSQCDRVEGEDQVVTLPVDSLLSADTPRLAGENAEHTRTLAESEAELPPIVVHRPTMRVVDGMHRLRAATLRGADTIKVRFVDGDERDTFVLAVRLNIKHGLPLSLADRIAAAARIVASHPEWSDRSIAAATGLAAKTVSSVRATTGEIPPSNTRIGLDGRARPLNSAEGRRLASVFIRDNPGASLREIAKASGISLSTARDVRERLNGNKDPVPVRLRRAEPCAGPAQEPRPVPGSQVVEQMRLKDRDVAVQALLRDPSLRFSDAGRNLLRSLSTHIALAASRQQLLECVPERWNSTVVKLAYECSKEWYEFARQLKERGSSASDRRPSEPAC